IGLYGSVTTVLSFVAGLPWGAVGVAAAYTITEYVVRVPVIWAYTGRKGPISTSDLFATAVPHGLATLVTWAVLWQMSSVSGNSNVFAYIGLALSGYLIYVVVILSFAAKRQMLLRNLASVCSALAMTRGVNNRQA